MIDQGRMTEWPTLLSGRNKVLRSCRQWRHPQILGEDEKAFQGQTPQLICLECECRRKNDYLWHWHPVTLFMGTAIFSHEGKKLKMNARKDRNRHNLTLWPKVTKLFQCNLRHYQCISYEFDWGCADGGIITPKRVLNIGTLWSKL